MSLLDCLFVAATHEVLPSGIGYVRIEDFTETTSEELQEAMQHELSACQAIIIDLRGNCGGMVGTAADIAASFLPYGTVISRLTRADGTMHNLKSLNRLPNMHTALCIVVDGKTASASEALAAALADHGRAVVWGRPTFGKVGLSRHLTCLPIA
jgi:carboxyl-terminal processing protease